MDAGLQLQVLKSSRETTRRPEALVMRGRDAGAIPASHQHTILGPAHIGDAHREPNPDCRQRDRKGQGRQVGQHAMPEIVRIAPRLLVAGQIIRLTGRVLPQFLLAQSPRVCRSRRRARSELDYAALVVRCDGLLRFHWQLQGAILLARSRARLTRKLLHNRRAFIHRFNRGTA